MHTFDDLSAVQSSLQHLMKREPPLVQALPRQPGTKETRYGHLLSGEIAVGEPAAKHKEELADAHNSLDHERLKKLEEETTALRNEIADLKQQFALFRKQFE